ncbi:hypothetical protein FISHEDRAFT_55570 [Fistulina hepatica ATCC 64428]|uniref:Arylsulfotransferase n=1 Tax=Fistulina hepatica ATCC 64428 TaxID=1128425 RepID=A0A0D7AMX1_9AGAR|nr:hypothetical protein FISHEDRAFT_55570 [Fistulina hepatica ATCC 64428]
MFPLRSLGPVLSLSSWFLGYVAALDYVDCSPPSGQRSLEERLTWEDVIHYTHSFKSTNLAPVKVCVTHRSTDKDKWVSDDVYYVICPRGAGIPHPGPLMVDTYGNPVWFGNFDCFNFNVFHVKDRPVITYWTGLDQNGYGKGRGHFLDSSYRHFTTLRPYTTTGADLHEFNIPQVLGKDTALISSYVPTPWDLSTLPNGTSKSWVLDGIFMHRTIGELAEVVAGQFQELNITDGSIVFNWSTAEHIPLDRTYVNAKIFQWGMPERGTGDSPYSAFDAFHINAIDKNEEGDYIISYRHLHQVVKVNGTTGDVIWSLGGKESDLELGEGVAFYWQHDVRWQGVDHITLFDNGAADWVIEEPMSRGLYIKLDEELMVATLEKEWGPVYNHTSQSQGSVQLWGENVVMGYGSNPWIEEYTWDGEVVFAATIGPTNRSLTINGIYQSYRAFKVQWTGSPHTLPDIAAEGNDTGTYVYVSWNGQTQTRSYRLYGTTGFDFDDIKEIKTVSKGREFETTIPVDDTLLTMLEVAALDADGRELGRTCTLQIHT